MDNNMTNNNI